MRSVVDVREEIFVGSRLDEARPQIRCPTPPAAPVVIRALLVHADLCAAEAQRRLLATAAQHLIRVQTVHQRLELFESVREALLFRRALPLRLPRRDAGQLICAVTAHRSTRWWVRVVSARHGRTVSDEKAGHETSTKPQKASESAARAVNKD